METSDRSVHAPPHAASQGLTGHCASSAFEVPKGVFMQVGSVRGVFKIEGYGRVESRPARREGAPR